MNLYNTLLAKSLSGGGGGSTDIVIAHFTVENDEIVCDKSYAELVQAIQENKPVIFLALGEITGLAYTDIIGADDAISVNFNTFDATSDTSIYMYHVRLSVMSDDTVDIRTFTAGVPATVND